MPSLSDIQEAANALFERQSGLWGSTSPGSHKYSNRWRAVVEYLKGKVLQLYFSIARAVLELPGRWAREEEVL
jgi:hypothetical protein